MRIVHIPIGVGCCCFIHAIGMREPDNRIKQLQFPHLFILVIIFLEGTREELIIILMEDNGKMNEELQSRRDFFKKLAKGTLPLLGGIALSNLPLSGNASNQLPNNQNEESEVKMGCDWGCTGGCKASCGRVCSYGCTNSCSGGCDGACKGYCQGTCKGSCSSSCSGYTY